MYFITDTPKLLKKYTEHEQLREMNMASLCFWKYKIIIWQYIKTEQKKQGYGWGILKC